MSKTSLLLLAILLIAAGCYGYIKLTPQTSLHPLLSKNTPVTPSPMVSEISLIASPVHAGQAIQVLAVISPAESKTGLVQLEIGFDPLVLTAQSIVPGTYFANPKLYLKNVNQHTGRISYALGCMQNTNNTPCLKKQNQPAVIITFMRSAYGKTTPTTVRLLPKTLLKTVDDTTLPFKTADVILALSGTTTPVASGEAVRK